MWKRMIINIRFVDQFVEMLPVLLTFACLFQVNTLGWALWTYVPSFLCRA